MYENYKYLSQMVFNLNLNDNVITNTISPFNEILLFFIWTMVHVKTTFAFHITEG